MTLLEAVRERMGDALLDDGEQGGQAWIRLASEPLVEAMTALRDDRPMRFNFLMDLTGVDHLERAPRFEVVYQLAAIEVDPHGAEPSRLSSRLRVHVAVPETSGQLPSICAVYPSANWMEREAWDLYGIRFEGHPNLRRILLDDDFEGHPLRKDYPKRARSPLSPRTRDR